MENPRGPFSLLDFNLCRWIKHVGEHPFADTLADKFEVCRSMYGNIQLSYLLVWKRCEKNFIWLPAPIINRKYIGSNKNIFLLQKLQKRQYYQLRPFFHFNIIAEEKCKKRMGIIIVKLILNRFLFNLKKYIWNLHLNETRVPSIVSLNSCQPNTNKVLINLALSFYGYSLP